MEAEPPPWHVAGEAGGVIGEEATLRRQSLRGVAAGVLQQELPEPLEDIPVFRCGGKVMPLHGIPVQVEQQGVAACGGVDQLLLPLHDAEIPVQAIAEEDSVFRQVRYRQQVPTGAPLRAVLPRHGQDRGVDVRQGHRAVNPDIAGNPQFPGQPPALRKPRSLGNPRSLRKPRFLRKPRSLGRHDQQGHMGAALEEQVLLGHVVVAQHLPVIRGEDHPGVLEQVVLPHGPEDAPQLVVHLGDAGVVGTAAGLLLFGAQQVHVGILVSPRQEALGGDSTVSDQSPITGSGRGMPS